MTLLKRAHTNELAALEAINNAALALQAENPSWSKEKARAQAMANDPSLYTQWREAAATIKILRGQY